MKHREEKMGVQVDAYTRVCLTVIAALLTVLIVGLWAEGVPSADRAEAAKGATGAGILRAEAVAAQKATTAKVSELIALLKSGDVKIRVIAMPKESPGGTNAAKPGKK